MGEPQGSPFWEVCVDGYCNGNRHLQWEAKLVW